MSGPLEGIRVIDCSIWLQGPMAGCVLGDLGAEVIKIEERGRGDQMRGLLGVFYNDQRNVQFETVNRNKRGIALDLRKQEGRGIVHKLVEKSDVFLHNFRSQAAERLGISYETLSSLNPRLVYAQATAWGPEGPDSEKSGLDRAAVARAGLMYFTEDKPEPQSSIPIAVCDMAGGQCLALSTLAALQARERTGRGQMVSTSLLGSLIALSTWVMTYSLGYGVEHPRPSRMEIRNPLHNSYKCADGEWIYLTMMQAEKYWPPLCEATGIKELENDPRFDNIRAMEEHSGELTLILDRVFAAKPRAEWMRILAKRDLSCAPIQKPLDLVNDPQVIANDYIVEYDHPTYGRQKVVGFPYTFSETPASLRRPCPELGQHTEEVLLELGYTWSDIAGFKEREVI
ncbi:CaiB/BaiF CoA transferase family protein [Chloroflexota bacterium]